jgi:hypothetical protein
MGLHRRLELIERRMSARPYIVRVCDLLKERRGCPKCGQERPCEEHRADAPGVHHA